MRTRIKRAARRAVVSGMERLGTLPAARRRADPGRAVILRYHSVSPFDAPQLLYRSPSVAVEPDTFERQMRFLADEYEVVPLGHLVDCLAEERPFPLRAVAITFDDGYRDNYEYALPVLRALDLPATVYVTTGAIGDGWRFWLSRVRAALLATTRGAVELDGLGRFELSSPRARERATSELTRGLKRLTVQERDEAIDRLLEQIGPERPPAESSSWFMSWQELREMSAAGIEIAAHTRNHPILTRLPDEAASAEMRGSRAELEAELGCAVEHFAYPNGGGVENHDERIVALARAAGFRSAATSVNAVLRFGADRFRLPRLGVAERHALDGLALNLERDRVFPGGGAPARPRILLVGPPTDVPGGISTCVRSLLDSVLGARFEISHLSPISRRGYNRPKLEALAALGRALSVMSWRMLRRRPALVQVHTAYGNDFWRNAPFVLTAWVCRVPSVLIVHGSRFDRAYEEAGAIERAAIRFVLRRAGAIAVRGEYWRRVLDGIASDLPIHLLPTTTEPPAGPGPDHESRWRAPTVLFVGGTPARGDNVRKGLPDLLAIVPELLASRPDVRVRIVGPHAEPRWTELALGHVDRVEFMGSLAREEVSELYRDAAVFVLPSHAEGMPNAVLEAMAYGLPIVATRVGSIPEVVEEGVGGFLVPPGAQPELRAALARVLSDPDAALRMGEHNRNLVRDRYSNRHTAERLLAMYTTVLPRRHVSAWLP